MTVFTPTDPDFRQATAEIFANANFIADLGIEPLTILPGRVEARLALTPRHLQHSAVVHAGVQATLADHTAGAAGQTLLAAGQGVLTSNFTINLLAPARGAWLLAKAGVIKAGRRLIVVESDVFAGDDQGERLVSRALVNLMVLPEIGAGEKPSDPCLFQETRHP